MARIVYAAAGGGYGHATRAHSVGAGLIRRGHSVRFMASPPASTYLEEQFPGLVEGIFGITLRFSTGRLLVLQTVRHNLRRACVEVPGTARVIRRLFRDLRPDLVVTDLEPLSAYWALRLGIPFVSLDNFHVLTHCTLAHPPGLLRDRMAAYMTIRAFYARARRYLITTFFDARVRHQPASLVPPILRPEVYRATPASGDYLVAYNGAGQGGEPMRRALEACDRMPVRAYRFGRTDTAGHMIYKAPSKEEFLADLAGCAGAVGTAGHSLISECLHLDKPMLLFPLASQYEQLLNTYHVERLGSGQGVHRPHTGTVPSFIDNLAAYRRALMRRPKRTLEPVLDAIEREIP